MFADVCGLDGQFTMAAIDEYRQLYAARTAMVEERVERSADGSAGIEDIVAKHNVAALDIKTNCPFSDHRSHVRSGKIVAVELDVEHTGIDGMLLDAGDQLAEPLGQGNAPPLDSYQRQVFAAVALFNNLVGQAH